MDDVFGGHRVKLIFKNPPSFGYASGHPLFQRGILHLTRRIIQKKRFNKKRTFYNAVMDALAMNLNDLAMVGAIPYAVQNQIVLPLDDHEAILQIVRFLAIECKKRKIAMTGGETSIHSDTKGMDISITVSGLLSKKLKNQCKVGDILIGFPSNGLHSNGITKAKAPDQSCDIGYVSQRGCQCVVCYQARSWHQQ